MTDRKLTCFAPGCTCMNSPLLSSCARCSHDVRTRHFETTEFICGRAAGDAVYCGSCGEEVSLRPETRSTGQREALALHFQEQHPELARSPRLRDRTVDGVRYFFFA